MARPETQELNERQRLILQALVEDYIATAEPVGSRSLTKRNPHLDLSPASVRNTMADLEDSGFLAAPHASAGRVPTALAFRTYVEQLASRGRITAKEQQLINAVTSQREDSSRDIAQILRETGRVLSTLSHHAALVLLPNLDEVVFADIEFVPVRERTVLVVFVAKSGLIQHRVVDVDFLIDRDELRTMSNYLKSLLGGKTLAQIRETILRAMRDEQAQADRLMRQALSLGERTLTLSPAKVENVLVEGEASLLEQPEFADITRMRKLLRAFEEKTVLLRLLDAALHPPTGVQAAERRETQVLFGADGSVRELQDVAVVLTSYGSENAPSGHVGIVGPMRMDYSRVVPLVEWAAHGLDRSFGDGSKDEEDKADP